MNTSKVIISKTHVFTTGYSDNGATIIFMEAHDCEELEHASNTDAVTRAKAAAFNYCLSGAFASLALIIQEDVTEDQVLSGKFNDRF